ncbi:hypothetical protein PGTUg99_003554 [Puccinia graminis f. sp. tritici]|uniref:Uncharacterized protein n=1 Tax=Puccinia graminis f. sp. tritici TaxID=56615 RepID=A0A5B0RGZ3_PUCGR|nr:hypothetical protein PGTUg99_003554 [Puccinia graminis f. sp. tritici]
MSSAGRDLMSQRSRVSSSNGLAVLHPWTNQPTSPTRSTTNHLPKTIGQHSTPQLDDAFIGRLGGCNIELGVGVGVFVEDFGNRGREVTRRSQRAIAGWSAPGDVPRVVPRDRWRAKLPFGQSKFAPERRVAAPLELL